MLNRLHSSSLLAACALLVVSSGCSMMPVNKKLAAFNLTGNGDGQNADGQGIFDQQPIQRYTLEVRGFGRSPKISQLTLDGTTHIQDVVTNIKADRRFRRMDITLVRQGQDGMPMKLDVPFERADRVVSHLHNYALQPNDHLIIAEDPSNIVTDMLNSVTEPVSSMLPPIGR